MISKAASGLMFLSARGALLLPITCKRIFSPEALTIGVIVNLSFDLFTPRLSLLQVAYVRDEVVRYNKAPSSTFQMQLGLTPSSKPNRMEAACNINRTRTVLATFSNTAGTSPAKILTKPTIGCLKLLQIINH
jgi:hypothetical protein